MEEYIAEQIVFDLGMGTIYKDYSGRGMFGRTTTAVEINEYENIKEVDEFISIENKRATDPDYYDGKPDQEILSELIFNDKHKEDELNNFMTDNMGMGYILY